CVDDRVERMARLPPDDPAAWDKQAEAWAIRPQRAWALASVDREALLRHAKWMHRRGDSVRVLMSWKDLGVHVRLEQPERVGLDRLLNVVAAKDRVKRSLTILIV